MFLKQIIIFVYNFNKVQFLFAKNLEYIQKKIINHGRKLKTFIKYNFTCKISILKVKLKEISSHEKLSIF